MTLDNSRAKRWFWIDPLRCVGCSTCLRNCPANAIDAALIIDTERCIQCGRCARGCWFGAVFERTDHEAVHYRKVRPEN